VFSCPTLAAISAMGCCDCLPAVSNAEQGDYLQSLLAVGKATVVLVDLSPFEVDL
jgi:hypothetical protein